jgi:hypothetical protein
MLVPYYHQSAVDERDTIVPAWKTIDLQKRFSNSKILSHNEGK